MEYSQWLDSIRYVSNKIIYVKRDVLSVYCFNHKLVKLIFPLNKFCVLCIREEIYKVDDSQIDISERYLYTQQK